MKHDIASDSATIADCEMNENFKPHDIDVYHLKEQLELLTIWQRVKFFWIMLNPLFFIPFTKPAGDIYSVDIIDKHLLRAGGTYIRLIKPFWKRSYKHKVSLIASRPHLITKKDVIKMVSNDPQILSIEIKNEYELIVIKHSEVKGKYFPNSVHLIVNYICQKMVDHYGWHDD